MNGEALRKTLEQREWDASDDQNLRSAVELLDSLQWTDDATALSPEDRNTLDAVIDAMANIGDKYRLGPDSVQRAIEIARAKMSGDEAQRAL